MTFAQMIAIDGPAGSGKSTLGRSLAGFLHYLYFDTGVMYRALTYACLQRNISIQDEKAVSELAAQLQIEILPPSVQDGRDCDVLVSGRDVTLQIRTTEVNQNVSRVAAYPGVRHALTAQQRRIGLRGRVVMVGRDIGTAVLPEADLKIFLDASLEERARRRHAEILAAGKPAELGDIRASLAARDQIDSTRAVAPLRVADDAVIVDSDHLDAEQVLELVCKLAARAD